MKIVVIDGQGGKLGRELVVRLKAECPRAFVMAIGTNAIATQAMLKSAPDAAATGENPVLVAVRDAQIVLGPVGIAVADSLCGEVTPAMALAVAQSCAKKILIPFNRCDTLIAGIRSQSGEELVGDAVQKVKELINP